MDGVIVLGAGLAGLGFARELPGCRVFEAAPHVGGHAYSHPFAGGHFDQGAHICHSKDADWLGLLTAAAGEVAEIGASVVRNWWGGRWVTYPVQNHLHELPHDLRVRALSDLVEAHTAVRGEPAHYRDWCLAQYGTTLTDTFYEAFTAKYWRVPTADLATDWLGGRLLPSVLPRIVRGAFEAVPEQQAAFARFRYPARGGFFGFFAPLYDGLNITCNERAVELDVRRRRVHFASGRCEGYDALASSLPLPELVRITPDAPAEIRDAAARLRHTQLLCVNVVVNRPRLTDSHWFYVYDADIDTARVSVPSNLSPGSFPASQTALQAEVFRRNDEALPASTLAEQAVADLGRMLGFAPSEVAAAGHVRVPRAYVISDHARAGAVAAIRGWYEGHGVHTMGLYGRWKYVWSDEAFRQGRETAGAVAAARGARRAG
jgi:protoporphyrinogen oxidase